MKIALFVSQFPVRSQTFVIRQAMDIVSAGHDLTVISMSAGDEWSEFSADVQARLAGRTVILDQSADRHWLPSAIRQIGAPGGLAILKARLKALRLGMGDLTRRMPLPPEGKPVGHFDAVLAHFGPSGVTAMILRAAGLFSGPIATVFHGYDMSVRSILTAHRKSYRALFRETEMMLPISRLWQNRLTDWGCDPAKMRVLHMGTELPAVMPAFDRPISDPLKVVCVGRLTEKKGQRDAIGGVAAARSAISFNIIGEGELEAELSAIAARDERQAIRLLGPMKHHDVLQRISNADVFLLPSKVARDGGMEGIPVALMEAMARGTIVLATDHSGNSELVADGVTGFLVAEQAPEEIAARLDDIASGKVDLPAIRRAAYKKVEAEFDNAKLAPELLQILQDVAGAE